MSYLPYWQETISEGVKEFSRHPLRSIYDFGRDYVDLALAVAGGLALTKAGRDVFGDSTPYAAFFAPVASIALTPIEEVRDRGPRNIFAFAGAWIGFSSNPQDSGYSVAFQRLVGSAVGVGGFCLFDHRTVNFWREMRGRQTIERHVEL